MNKKKTKNQESIVLKGIKIANYTMLIHLNLTKNHLSKYKGTFICEGLPLHEKEFIKESSIRIIDSMLGKYGKSKTTFYLNENDSPMFNTIEKLIEYYHIIDINTLNL